jgi:hypothetical protein
MKAPDRKKEPTRKTEGLRGLRRMWREAMADDRPGVAPGEVFARLLRKYGAKRVEAK